jgi:excisionase family DNA binding protein
MNANMEQDWTRLGELARDPRLRERALTYCEGAMKLYDVEELADVLRVTPKTVRAWIRSGELRASDLGHRMGFRVAEEDLQAFLATRIVIPKTNDQGDEEEGEA